MAVLKKLLGAMLVLLAQAAGAEGLLVTPAREWVSMGAPESRKFTFKVSSDSGHEWSAAIESFRIDSEGSPTRAPRETPADPFQIVETSKDSIVVGFVPDEDSRGSFWAALVVTGSVVRQTGPNGTVDIEPVLVIPMIVTIGENPGSLEVESLEAVRKGNDVHVVAIVVNRGSAVRFNPSFLFEKAGDVPLECELVEEPPVVILPGMARAMRVRREESGCADQVVLILPGNVWKTVRITGSGPLV